MSESEKDQEISPKHENIISEERPEAELTEIKIPSKEDLNKGFSDKEEGFFKEEK